MTDYTKVKDTVRTRNVWVMSNGIIQHLVECGVCFSIVYMDRLHTHTEIMHPEIQARIEPIL